MLAWLAILPLSLTAATAAAVLALLAAEARGSSTGKWIAKPLASAGFVALALARDAPATLYGRFVLGALACSFLGDVCLIRRTPAWFRAGLGSFLVGHLAFAAAFVARGLDGPAAAVAAVPLAAAAFAVGRWLLPRVEPKLRPPVIAYILAITIMVALAAGTFRARPQPLLIAGAVAFYISDLSVARDTFVARGFVNRLWGLPLYYAAQVMLAFTIGSA